MTGSREKGAPAGVGSLPRLRLAPLPTSWGLFRLGWTARGIAWLGLPGPDGGEAPPAAWLSRHFRPGEGAAAPAEPPGDVAGQLEAFLAGRSHRFDLPLDLRGTPFQLAVWRELLRLGWGERLSYGELALRLDRPGAARAVGAAVGANPVPVVVPCHRVVAAHGLGGYAGGEAMKRRLLLLEGGGAA
jgi:methylated-DNA-[protein]-cysteine S-methyltransferase